MVEMILAIIVISAIAGVVAYIMISSIGSYGLITARREALNEARTAMNLMSTELQTVTNPSVNITAVSSTSMTFNPAAGGSVTYSISGGNLLRDSNNLAKNVTANSAFTYYTTAGATTTTPSQVARVHIALEVDTGSTAYGKVMVVSDVYLRNLYYNSYTQQ